MQELLRWLAGLKGIAVDADSEVRFELSSFPTGGLALLVLLGLVLAIALIVALYRREGQNLARGRRVLLATLRGLAVAVALLLVFEPNLVAVKREVRPGHSILLLDVSQSMGHKDAFRREETRDLLAGWRALGVEDPAAVARKDLLAALLAHRDGALLTRLAARNRVLLYGFAGGAEPLPDAGALHADGRQSNIGGAVRTALEHSREASVAAVVLLTDGRRNLGPQAPEIARLLAQRKVPHTLVLGVGDPSQTQTIEVARIDVPEKVFQKDPFRVRAQLGSQGYDAQSVTVRLLQSASGGAPGEQVASRTVQLGGSAADVTVEFDQITALAAGTFTYRVEVQPPSGEPPSPERHAKQAQVEVLSEQTKVLLIAGSPAHEYRILRNELTRDKTIEVACWLTSADRDFPQDGNRSLQALPADRAELDEWDVAILVDPDPSKLTREFCDLLAEHVAQRGAGLWWVCGDKHSLAAMQAQASTQPLVELLPIVPDLVKADYEIFGLGKVFPVAWPLELTPIGGTHKAARLLDDKAANTLLWPQLPGAHFAFPVLRSKPAATALVRHGNPKLRGPDGAMPLIVTHFVGGGRVLFCGTDETYRWRSVFEEAYNRYWVKGIRYLYEGRLSAGNARFSIRPSEEKIELGEAVRIVVDAKDEGFQPLLDKQLELHVERDGAPAQTVPLAQVEAVPGQYETTLRPDATGFYRLSPVHKTRRDLAVTFQVVPAAVEKEGPVDLEFLAALADVPGGALLRTPDALLEAVERVPSLTATNVVRTPHAIWDTWVTVLILLALLAAEWWLRKMANLL
jgi:hypothetical protein